jgi:putative membrane protein
VRVDVDVAGYSGSGEQQLATSALLPVAPRELALQLVARVLGSTLPPADRPVPRAARWRAPLSARRLSLGLDGAHVVSTSGVLTTTTDIAPLAKVQSLRRTSGPWQRRLGLASVHVDTAGRRLPGAVLLHRSEADAAVLLAELTERARGGSYARRCGPARFPYVGTVMRSRTARSGGPYGREAAGDLRTARRPAGPPHRP